MQTSRNEEPSFTTTYRDRPFVSFTWRFSFHTTSTSFYTKFEFFPSYRREPSSIWLIDVHLLAERMSRQIWKKKKKISWKLPPWNMKSGSRIQFSQIHRNYFCILGLCFQTVVQWNGIKWNENGLWWFNGVEVRRCRRRCRLTAGNEKWPDAWNELRLDDTGPSTAKKKYLLKHLINSPFINVSIKRFHSVLTNQVTRFNHQPSRVNTFEWF